MNPQQPKSSATSLDTLTITLSIISLIVSFIPCFGILGFIGSSISLVIGMVSYYNANKKNQSIALSLTGMTISVISSIIISFTTLVLIAIAPLVSALEVIIIILYSIGVYFIFKKNNNTNSIQNYNTYNSTINNIQEKSHIGSNIYTIGRLPTNNIIINDPTVSKNHAEITLVNNEIYVRDLDSTNGTFVNGVRIYDKSILRYNDILKVGNSIITWEKYIV